MLKKRNLIILSLLILGVLLLTSCFLNSPATEGILKGQVMVPEGTLQTKDLTGQALPDATVSIIDLSTGSIIATTVTDANGYYQISIPPGGPYLLEAVKDGVKLQQITPQVEVGIEYDLGIADYATTAVALIAQAMLVNQDYPNNLPDINLTDIEAVPDFDDVMSAVCSVIEAGGDPTASVAIEQAVENFLHPPVPALLLAPTVANAEQAAPTGLAGVAPTTYGGLNGKITGTTTAMEYKLSTGGSYTAATETEITGLAAGTYNIRYKAKAGYNAGTAADVVVPALAIGHSYGGGKVAYILLPGESNGVYNYDAAVQHGLIAATSDQSLVGIRWYNGSYTTTGATGTALGTGLVNTTTIITSQGATATNYAAGLARAYNGGSYSDWFLPSKDELNKLYINQGAIGGFEPVYYWSSSERCATLAWYQNFDNGYQRSYGKYFSYAWVRAVRAF